MQASDVQEEIARYPWYHTLELGNGVVTPGMFDHRGTEPLHLIPESLNGQRCLDIGTMDGYWAFLMERRGAAEVVAVDLDDPDALDWPPSLRTSVTKTIDETKGARFALARSALDSSVVRHLSSVYALDPSQIGTFDFVFCGDLLAHLKDPATALQRIHSVCRGSAVVCNPIREHFPYRNRPLAVFDGIDEFEWWLPNRAALVRMLRSAGFVRVVAGDRFSLPATGGGSWKGQRCAVRGWVQPETSRQD